MAEQPREHDFQIELFFDGECPLCMREVSMLRRLDTRSGRSPQVRFTDISAEVFDPRACGLPTEIDMTALMARIHGRLPSGEVLEGVEVFRRTYEAVGLTMLSRLSRLPGARQLADAAYAVFARNRLRRTGRCTADGCEVPSR